MALTRTLGRMRRSGMKCVRVAVALTVTAYGLPAQDVTTRPETRPDARCDSVIAAATRDSTRLTTRLLLTLGDTPLPSPLPYLLLLEVATQLEVPRPLRVPVFSGAPALQTLRVVKGEVATLRHPVIDGAYAFTLRRDASVTRARVTRPSRVPGLDSAMVAAVARAGREGSLAPFGDDVPADSVDVYLRLTSTGDRRGLGLDLFSASFPRVTVADAVVREMPAPEYPAEERKLAYEGDVWLQVVVDLDGEADYSTAEVLRTTTLGFARSALELLPRIRWTPARVGDCAVPQQVLLPVRFRLP